MITSAQGTSGLHQLQEFFLLRDPSSILAFNFADEAVFLYTFSSVPTQLSTPLVYFFNPVFSITAPTFTGGGWCGETPHPRVFLGVPPGASPAKTPRLNRATRTCPYVDNQAKGHPINFGTRALTILRGFLRLNTSLASRSSLPQHTLDLQGRGTGPANPSPPPE